MEDSTSIDEWIDFRTGIEEDSCEQLASRNDSKSSGDVSILGQRTENTEPSLCWTTQPFSEELRLNRSPRIQSPDEPNCMISPGDNQHLRMPHPTTNLELTADLAATEPPSLIDGAKTREKPKLGVCCRDGKCPMSARHQRSEHTPGAMGSNPLQSMAEANRNESSSLQDDNNTVKELEFPECTQGSEDGTTSAPTEPENSTRAKGEGQLSESKSNEGRPSESNDVTVSISRNGDASIGNSISKDASSFQAEIPKNEQESQKRSSSELHMPREAEFEDFSSNFENSLMPAANAIGGEERDATAAMSELPVEADDCELVAIGENKACDTKLKVRDAHYCETGTSECKDVTGHFCGEKRESECSTSVPTRSVSHQDRTRESLGDRFCRDPRDCSLEFNSQSPSLPAWNPGATPNLSETHTVPHFGVGACFEERGGVYNDQLQPTNEAMFFVGDSNLIAPQNISSTGFDVSGRSTIGGIALPSYCGPPQSTSIIQCRGSLGDRSILQVPPSDGPLTTPLSVRLQGEAKSSLSCGTLGISYAPPNANSVEIFSNPLITPRYSPHEVPTFEAPLLYRNDERPATNTWTDFVNSAKAQLEAQVHSAAEDEEWNFFQSLQQDHINREEPQASEKKGRIQLSFVPDDEQELDDGEIGDLSVAILIEPTKEGE